MKWRLHADGTIRPRFGFDAVNSSCVCNPHHHHVYWRLNFDVDCSKNNTVEEYNDPPLAGSSSHWHVHKYEIKRLRDPTQKENGELYILQRVKVTRLYLAPMMVLPIALDVETYGFF